MSRGRRALQIIAILASAPRVLLGESIPGHYTVAPLSPSVLENFVAAIQNDSVLSPPEAALPSDPVQSGEQRLLWAGAEIKTSLALGKLTVRFTRSAALPAPQESFELEISKEPERIVVRSTAPSHPAFAGGIIAPASSSTSFIKFIPGAKDTGFVTIIPKSPQAEWFSLAVCPANRTLGDGQFHFSSTAYTPASVRFAPKAEVRARQETGEASGKATISILTSTGIPRAATFERTVEQPSPRLEAIYFPDKSEAVTAEANQLVAGVRVGGELISPMKTGWSKSTEGVAYLIPFNLPTPIEISQDGVKSSFGGTGCVLVASGIFSHEQFE